MDLPTLARPDRRRALRVVPLVLGALGLIGMARRDDAPAKADPPPEATLSARDMIGRVLRVVRPGEVVTMDYREDRVTVSVDEADRIIDMRIG